MKTEESVYQGARCVFLRTGSEHHSLALFPKELRAPWGSALTPLVSPSALKWAAISNCVRPLAFLKSHGVTVLDPLPPELALGMDYVAYALDPDGHCIQLYYYMEQSAGMVGHGRRASGGKRPESGPRLWSRCPIRTSDQVYQGPLG